MRLLKVRQQPLDVYIIGICNQCGLPQVPPALGSLAGQQMTLISLVPLDLPGGSNPEPLGSAPVRLQFRHLLLLAPS